MRTKRTLAQLFIACVAVVTMAVSGLAAAQLTKQGAIGQETPVTVTIAAQSLRTALNQFAEQTGLQVVYAGIQTVRGVQAPAVSGTLTPSTILERLLASTGLRYQFVNAHTVRIFRPQSSSSASSASNAAKEHETLSTINVIGRVQALSATRSSTPIKEIPQTISVISQETIEQQNAVDLPSALKQAPGISLLRTNSQQVQLESRGFAIGAVHIDGSAPIDTVYGSVGVTARDIAEYSSIQVLRGSDALFGGAGDPGGSVDLQRKMPTPTFQSRFAMMAGSWDQYRVVGDVGGPLTSKWGGRVVVAASSQNYFFHNADQRERFIYGVLKYDLSPSTSVDFGGSYEKLDAINNFNGLPFYDNGQNPHLPRSTGINALWARSKTWFGEAFVELRSKLSKNWDWNTNLTFLRDEEPVFTISQYSGPISSTTKQLPPPGNFTALYGVGNDEQFEFNSTLTGAFHWLGHKQRVMVGVDYGHMYFPAEAGFTQAEGPPINVFAFNPDMYPPPDLSNPTLRQQELTKIVQSGIYGSTRITPIDHLSVILGGRLSFYRATSTTTPVFLGITLPTSFKSFDYTHKFTPYYAVTYDIGKHYTLYTSYTDIYNTNSGLITKSGAQLPPTNGDTEEAGVKSVWFNDTLMASFSVFNTKKKGVAISDPSVPSPTRQHCCYIPATATSKGYEFTISGALTPHWEITAGYTNNIVRLTDDSIIVHKPRSVVKLWTNYAFPRNRWQIGGGIRAFSVNKINECNYPPVLVNGQCQGVWFHQGFYAVADLRLAYMFDENWSLTLNANNLFDKTYYQTLGTLQIGNWYGAPRNVMLKLVGSF